jgi:hypothetical protein
MHPWDSSPHQLGFSLKHSNQSLYRPHGLRPPAHAGTSCSVSTGSLPPVRPAPALLLPLHQLHFPPTRPTSSDPARERPPHPIFPALQQAAAAPAPFCRRPSTYRLWHIAHPCQCTSTSKQKTSASDS